MGVKIFAIRGTISGFLHRRAWYGSVVTNTSTEIVAKRKKRRESTREGATENPLPWRFKSEGMYQEKNFTIPHT